MATLVWASGVARDGVLALDDVAFAYPDGGEVVSGLSLCLTPACATVILGANGTGKSTIGRLATGQLRPTRGLVRAGVSPVPARSIPRLSAIVDGRRHDSGEESAAALPSATWREGVAATLAVDEVLGRRSATLSAGERQRRSLALALLVGPDVLILDAPCAGLDEVHREVSIDLLTFFRERGGAVLPVTSDVALAHAVSDRIGVLSGGACGVAACGRRRYRRPVAAAGLPAAEFEPKESRGRPAPFLWSGHIRAHCATGSRRARQTRNRNGQPGRGPAGARRRSGVRGADRRRLRPGLRRSWPASRPRSSAWRGHRTERRSSSLRPTARSA